VAVAIVGGGPAGSHLAGLLAVGGLEVCLITEPPISRPYLETLSAQARPWPIGSWGHCVAHASAWGADDVEERPAIVSPWGADGFVERPALEVELCAQAVSAGALLVQDTVTHVEREAGDWILTTGSGDRHLAEIVIDATGRSRRIARKMGAARAARLDRLVGYPATISGPIEYLRTRTLVVADPLGWWFLGPSAQGGASAIFFTDADLVGGTPLRTVTTAWSRLRAVLPETLHLQTVSRPRPAWSEALLAAAGPGWLAVGDAAATFDPLSSSGLFFAQTSAELASKCVSAGAIRAYASQLQPMLDTYAASHRKVYARERRFAEHPFWRRRRVGPHDIVHTLPAT
jgi:flavin-dependent dehydrogenase